MNSNTYKFYLISFFVILALPLFIASPWFFPAAWGKVIVFRIIISILAFFLIQQILSKKTDNKVLATAKQILSKKNKVFLPFWLLIALLGIFLLATIFSLNPFFSFWGSPLRSGGFLNFSFYIFFAILVFLFVNKKDWQKIWIFTISVGVLVSIIAVFQQFNILSKIIISYSGRPPSTMGGPTFLALYLLLLTFITISFFLKEKGIKKKLLYFFALLIFLYVIMLTGSRAAYFGLAIGFIYFILCFPKKNRLIVLSKILFVLLLIVGAYGAYYVNVRPKLPNYLQESKISQEFSKRLSINMALEDPRYSVWVISIEAIKERPILGYGPENFSIGFYKHYNSLLPYITKTWGSWYDRAHNFLFDISVTAGIPALIIYLSLFASLFWRLQKVKEKQTENSLISHGIQATFFGYLATNFFSFDLFSTYLIFFLIVGYSLSLITQTNELKQENIPKKTFKNLKPTKSIFLSILFLILVWFIWSFNLKPLQVNKEINLANSLSKDKKDYNQALLKIENIMDSYSVLDIYVRENYLEIIGWYVKEKPAITQELNEKAIKALKENTETRPYYTRNWILLGGYTNMLIEKETRPEFIEKLKQQADYSFKRASELSPNRQEIFINWTKTGLITGEYQKAKERSQQCINLNPELADCWWFKAFSNIYLGEMKEAQMNIKVASEKYYPTDSKFSLSQLINAYAKIENYQELIKTYNKLVKLEPANPQYHASLALAYNLIGDYKKAREEALIVLELSPESKAKVEEFLKSLPN